jgi:hypothetical protein
MILHISITIAVIVILTLFMCGCQSRVTQCGDFLTGFWKADPGWCANAGISNAYATINFFPKKNCGQIYLLMQNLDNQIIDNDSYKFKTSAGIRETAFTNQRTTEYKLKFLDSNTPANGTFPTLCNLRINITNGIIVLHDGSTVYLELYKDNMTSSRVERMSYKETYLPKQERTDPQKDVTQSTEGEDISPVADESEGQSI